MGDAAGVILAAAGSAVGSGNIWRFPWVTAENGGRAFLAAYLAVVLLVGVPGLPGELVVGRRAARGPVEAPRDLSGSRTWGLWGGFYLVTAIALISFSSVVGGWLLRYFGESALGVVGPQPAYFAAPGTYFGCVAAGGRHAARVDVRRTPSYPIAETLLPPVGTYAIMIGGGPT